MLQLPSVATNRHSPPVLSHSWWLCRAGRIPEEWGQLPYLVSRQLAMALLSQQHLVGMCRPNTHGLAPTQWQSVA
jgi:hypothetical protein